MRNTVGLRTHLLLSVAVGCLISASADAALAQTPASSTATDDSNVSAIVVTATKRAVELGKVPVSISAYTQEAMDRRAIRDIKDVALQTPGVDIPSSTSGSSTPQRISIRGIDSNAGAATSAVYIDDTPIQARNAAINYSGSTIPYIFDLDRVEVLRGPQGTLFGASAQGGAIRFITPTPSLTRYSTYARARIGLMQGGDASYEGGVAVGGPIIEDKLGFRVSLLSREDGGWIDRQSWQNPQRRKDNANSSNVTMFRGALLFKPTDWLTLQPSVFYQNVKSDDRAQLWTKCPATDVLKPSLVPCPRGVADPKRGRFYSYNAIAQPGSDKFYVPALKATVETGPVTLTSVTSYLYRHVNQLNDATYGNDRISYGLNYILPVVPGMGEVFTYQNPDTHQRLAIQEFRAANANADARLRWTAGVYFSRASLNTNLPITSAHRAALYQAYFGRPYPTAQYLVNGTELYHGNEATVEKTAAAFANIDYDIVDRLTLSLGGRVSKDTLRYDVLERGPSYAGGIQRSAGNMVNKPFTPRVSLSWQKTDDTLVYGSWAQGYRTGGVNKAVPDVCAADVARLGVSDAKTYQPDKTDTFELGLKSVVLDRKLSFQASLFHTKWNNIQQTVRMSCAYSIVANTASAVSQGGEINVNYRVNSALTLSAAVGYTDAQYTKTIKSGSAPLVFDGQSLGATPWIGNVSAEYRFRVIGDRDAYARAQYTYKSRNDGPFMWQRSDSASYDPSRPDGLYGYKQLDVRAGVAITPAVNVELFVENALNTADWTENAQAFGAIGGSVWVGSTQKPRVFGLQTTLRY